MLVVLSHACLDTLLLLLLLLLSWCGCLPRLPQRVYGMLPKSDLLGSAAAEETCGFAFKHPEQPEEAGPMSEEDRAQVDLITQLFRDYVDAKQLVEDLRAASERPEEWVRELPTFPGTGNPNEAAGGGAKKRARAVAA